MLTARQSARLIALGTATIYEAQGQRGAVTEAIKPIDPRMSLSGRALTVDAGYGDNLMLHAGLLHAKRGDVLVVDAGGCKTAGAWGDLLTAAALHIGVAGLVIYGAVRDSQQIIDLNFPVFATGLSIRGTTKSYNGSIGTTVTIDGLTISTGDIIVGDRDGLVVIEADEIEQSLDLAEQREAKEDALRQQISNGLTTVELFNLEAAINEPKASRQRNLS